MDLTTRVRAEPYATLDHLCRSDIHAAPVEIGVINDQGKSYGYRTVRLRRNHSRRLVHTHSVGNRPVLSSTHSAGAPLLGIISGVRANEVPHRMEGI